MTIPVGQGDTATGSVALFVMGVSRSGTSALTRVLSLCGGTLPSALAGANASNPLGHWEPRAAIDINEAILYRHHSSVHDPTMRLQEDGALDAKEKAACISEIGVFLNKLPAAPLILIKEPRITALPGLWFEAARQANFDVAAVVAVRHPQEVIASLAARDGTSPELASALWLKYSLLAERYTRGLPRVFVEYANLLDNWRREITRISTLLAIELNCEDEAAIGEFLQQDLRRQRHRGPVMDAFGTDWISTVYETLCSAARDEPYDECSLDRVFYAYGANERDFRKAFEDFRYHFDFNSELQRNVFRPSITRKLRAFSLLATRLGMDPYRRRYDGQSQSDKSSGTQNTEPPRNSE